MTDDTTDTDQIEHDLAETRARMDRRLDQLGDKLSPNQLVNDALAHVSGGDGADFAQTLIAKARANPIPAALAGVGIAWLVASNQHRQRGESDLSTRLRSAEAGVVQLGDEHADVHASRLDDARGQVLGVARTASDTAASYAQRIRDALAATTQSVRETTHDLAGKNKGGGIRSLASNPIAIGAAAALVGLIVGALIPVTDQEERALGSLAGQLRDKGRDAAQTLVDRGAQVAGDAVGTLKDSAQTHGLTGARPVGELLGDLKSGELLGHVKQAAQDVVEAGKGSVRTQLVGDADGQR